MATVTHLDPIRTSEFIVAQNLCVRLASPMYREAMKAQSSKEWQDETYNAWWILRQTAERFFFKRSILLEEKDLIQLGDALRVARTWAEQNRPETEALDAATDVDGLLELFRSFDGARGILHGA